MTELATLARPYAKAIYSLAAERNNVEAISRDLAELSALIRDEALISYMGQPRLTAAEQSEIMCRAQGNTLCAETQGLVRELAHYKRLSLLPQVNAQFVKYVQEHQGSMDVEVVSAFAMSDSDLQVMAKALCQKFNRQVTMATEVDSSLLGGVVIRSGDMVIDASIRGKIAKLRDLLNSQV